MKMNKQLDMNIIHSMYSNNFSYYLLSSGSHMGQTATKPDKVNIVLCELKITSVVEKLADFFLALISISGTAMVDVWIL